MPLPDVELRRREALFGAASVPGDCFNIILRDADAGVVTYPEVDLRGGGALLRGFAVPARGLGVGVALFSRVPCRVVILGTGWRDREQETGDRAVNERATDAPQGRACTAMQFTETPETPVAALLTEAVRASALG